MVSFVHVSTERHLENMDIRRLLALCAYLSLTGKLETEVAQYIPHLAGMLVTFGHQNSIQ